MRFSATIGLALPVLAAAAPGNFQCSNPPAALYVLDQTPAGDNVVAFAIGNDGLLSEGVKTATGGVGLVTLTNHPTGSDPHKFVPGPTDSLFGSHAVAVSGNYLFAVNPGSNTVSVFWINPKDILHPTLIGKPAPSGGDFPQHVNYSPAIKTACVLNGGATAPGVQCFSVDPKKGLAPIGGLRPIHANNQTSPPTGPFASASDIVFNPSSTALFAVLKGNDGKTPSFIYAYPIEHGQVSTKPIISRPDNLPIAYNLEFINGDSNGIVTDPTYGYSTVAISSGFEVSVVHKELVPTQRAMCWTAYHPVFDTVFITDGNVTDINLANPQTGKITHTIKGLASNLGAFDLSIHNNFVYVLGGSPVISVYDASPLAYNNTPTLAQTYDIGFLGPRNGIAGTAIYVRK